MAKVTVYNLEGAETGTIELDDTIFSESAKPELIYQVVRVAQFNQRQPLAHTKDRGEVRGGGRKPWRQKGTGRARHGSIRSPLWRGGGVTFGPRKENITKLIIPKKMAKKALRGVLSKRVAEGGFKVVEGLAFKKPSTKKMTDLLDKLKLTSKKTLFLLDSGTEHIAASVNNISRVKPATKRKSKLVKPVRIENINILDLLGYETVVIAKDSVERLTKQLL